MSAYSLMTGQKLLRLDYSNSLLSDGETPLPSLLCLLVVLVLLQGSCRYQTPPPVRCCPWWASLSVRHCGKANLCCPLLSHIEYTIRPFCVACSWPTWRHPQSQKCTAYHIAARGVSKYTRTHACTHAQTHTHTHTHTLNGPLSRTTQVSRYQKGKPIWILLKQKTASGSSISYAICKSAPHSRQITMPPLSFLKAGCPSCHPTNSVTALKASK